MSEENKFSLDRHEAFSKINHVLYQSIVHKGEFLTGSKNEIFCQEGAPANSLYFLVSGNIVLLTKEGRKILRINENQGHFGWNKYEDKYTYTAVVDSKEAIVFKISKEALYSLFKSYKHLKDKLFIYRIPVGAYLFFKLFNLPGFNLEQDDFLTSFKLEFFQPGEIVVKKGDKADKFYMIASGNTKVTNNNIDEPEKIVNELNEGDYFGEIGLLEENNLRAANVIATSELSVFSLSKKAFDLSLSTKKGKIVKNHFYEGIKTYTLDIENITIGSDPDCQPRIQSDKIAPKHIRLTKKITKDGHVKYSVKPLVSSSQYKVFINKQLIKKETVFGNQDELSLGDYKIIIDTNRDAISLQKVAYYSLHVENLIYKIKNTTIIDRVSFSAESNELVCIMGPSGCGKSTILELIYGAKRQTTGNILYNHDFLHENLEYYRSIFGYVPQDDILFSELTVFQNLFFTAKLREPFATTETITKKVDIVLERLKLSDKKHQLVGSIEKKGLSGGERKRVNIARELIFDPHILFLDEPTSGLSSKDSEEIVSFLRNLADMGKLIFVVLHQPGSKIYKMFDKIDFLDMGGKLVYTGPVLDCIQYMKDVISDDTPPECPECKTWQPEIMFEVLEQKDEDSKRKFPPEFWQKRLHTNNGNNSSGEHKTQKLKRHPRQKGSFRENISQLYMLLQRTFLIKINNLSNILISIAAPVIIGLLMAIILRSSPDINESYSLYQNKLIVVYIFIGTIFSIFLGLTNSVRDIVSEQAIYNLENKIKLRIRWYVISKFIILMMIAAIQTSIFVLLCNFILDIRGVFLIFFQFFFLASTFGIAFGLFLSSIFRTSEAVVNWIPLVLIPQIILGGALIKYEDMSRYLFFNAEQVIPEICQFIPSRWAHEALTVSQATCNPRDTALEESKNAIKKITKKIKELRKNSSEHQEDIKKLTEERKRLRKEKGNIDINYPNDQYRNEVLEETVMNGSGIYYGYKKEHVQNEAYNSSLFFTSYKLKKESNGQQMSKRIINSPFYARYKGISIGEKYYEIETATFNFIILVIMIVVSLAACMITLMIKINVTYLK